MSEKKFSAVLAAGGSGTRFGGTVNKVSLPLDGQTVIGVSLDDNADLPRDFVAANGYDYIFAHDATYEI